jgi:hypothetical protein
MKRGSSSAGRSPYSRTRRWPRRRKWWAANMVGGEAGAAVRTRSAWAVPWFRPAGWRVGPDSFDIFPNYLNRFKLRNWERMPYLASKIPKFSMLLDWGILNNSLNCADIQFSRELELKILKQIHHLNLWWIFKWFNLFGKILLDLNFTKVNLVGITCMQGKELQSKCQMVWFEKNENSLNLKFKPYNIS